MIRGTDDSSLLRNQRSTSNVHSEMKTLTSVLLCLLLAGCATPLPSSTRGTPLTPTTTSTSTPSASPASTATVPLIAPPTAVASLPATAAWYRFESAAMSEGNRLLTLHFYGGLPYDPNDPCSVAYAGWAQPDGLDLEAAVLNVTPVRATSAPSSPPVACPLSAVERTVTVPLAQPFLGARVRDLAGGANFVRRPDGLEVLRGLPPGWSLRSEGDVAESQTGRWLRTYAPVPKPNLSTSRGHLDFYESLGSQVAISCGVIGTEQIVQVHGKEAHLSLCGADGELILEWPVGANDLALDANAADFSTGALIKLAESTAPG